MKLINKDALLAEIDRQKIGYNVDGNHSVEYDITRNIIDIINTLEVKEVDEQKERICECPCRKVVCTMYTGKMLECNGACSWVVDYPRLKELKAQEDMYK